MSKILAVFGATGNQGGSVVNYVLQDPELSQQFKIRAITRNVSSDKAKQLSGKVEVVQGDISDHASIEKALTGVHTVFIVTVPDFFSGPDGAENEYRLIKTAADIAVDKGAEYIIFSTLPSAKKISGGKYPNIIHFEGKAKAEQYIRDLPIKSAFFSGGFFMSNFNSMPWFVPKRAEDETYVMTRHNRPDTKVPMIDVVADTGKFIGAILAEPDKYEGKTFCAAPIQLTMDETAAVMSKATGKKVVYKQVAPEEWVKQFPFAQDIFIETFNYPEEFGYYGPDTDKLVAWAAENARGNMTTLEEYLKANPLQLA